MRIKIRGERINKTEAIIKIYETKKEKTQKRKELEKEVVENNELIIKNLINLLRPICNRVGMGLHVKIKDTIVEFSTGVTYSGKRHMLSGSCSITQCSPSLWFSSRKELEKNLHKLEITMRTFKKLLSNEHITFRNRKLVIVSIDTKTRYF